MNLSKDVQDIKEDNYMSWLSNNFQTIDNSREFFVRSLNKNNDHKVTVKELHNFVDQDHNQQISRQELSTFAIKAQAEGLEKSEVQILMAALSKAQHSLSLFEEEDSQWTSTSGLKNLIDQEVTAIPFNRNSLDSHNASQLEGVGAGILHVQSQHGNSCGTTSLSMIMKYFQGHTLENSVKTIDKHIRSTGSLEVALPTGSIKKFDLDAYTAPRDIISYANTHGMRAGMDNESTTRDLKSMLDKGVPCLCLTEWNFDSESRTSASEANPVGDAESLHWVNVVGYLEKVNPKTNKSETHFLIANPHGKVQEVPQSDFDKVWKGLGQDGHLLSIGGKNYIKTHIKRLMIAMVPRDDEAEVTAPDGTIRKAGDISIPNENDGFGGKVAQLVSQGLKWVGEVQDQAANIGHETVSDVKAGYREDGLLGAVNNFIYGNEKETKEILKYALKGSIETRANIIQQLMDLGHTRSHHEDAIYEILRDTSWSDFHQLISKLDVKQLASELESDGQAGKVLAWIAKAELDATGKIGTKFEGFATYLAQEHRDVAIDKFMQNKYTQNEGLFKKVSAGVIRNMIKELMDGNTDGGEETTIYRMFRDSSWDQFAKIMSRLDMSRVASELEDSGELANLTKWVIKSALENDSWGNLSEILHQLESTSEYFRADNVIGKVVMDDYLSLSDIRKIPSHLRRRMKTMVDDISRGRTNDAVAAYNTLKKM